MRRFITCFVTVFATVIAITKDLADVEGDRKYGIQTFSTRLGTRRVTFLGAWLTASLLPASACSMCICYMQACMHTVHAALRQLCSC